jgi:hypothetical protein
VSWWQVDSNLIPQGGSALRNFLFPILVIAVSSSILVVMITLISGTNCPGGNTYSVAAPAGGFTDFVERLKNVKLRGILD